MALIGVLSRALIEGDTPPPPETSVRAMLTRAQVLDEGTGGVKPVLTRALITGTTIVDAEFSLGRALTAPPFSEIELTASVVTPNVTVTSWTWAVQSTNPRVKTATLLTISGPQNSVASYTAPATVLGAVLTITATAQMPDRPSEAVSVVHTIRPHTWPWRIDSAGRYYPLQVVSP